MHANSTAEYTGGRVAILFLLFGLAIYEFIHAGFAPFAAICFIPVLILGVIIFFQRGMLLFWLLMFVNYFVQWKNFPSTGLPTSLLNELLELLLLALALIDVKESKFDRCANLMLFTLVVWASFCTLQVINDSCGLGIQVGAWYTGARMMAFQLIYAQLVYSLYIVNPQRLIRYLYVWGGLSIFAAFWVWKQQHFGLTQMENAFLWGGGRSTHVINGGATIRLFSTFNDAATFGINMAATSVCYLIMSLTCRIKKHKYFFIATSLICFWATFPSGTRTAIFCVFAGIAAYVVISKSIKMGVPIATFGILFYIILAFTDIGNGNAQVRRMRSGFNKNDASANQRTINQAIMKKYLADAPWGIGLGMGYDNVPANNKFRKLATIPPDSEYVFIWIRTGYVGIVIFIILTFTMLCGASWITMFKLKNKTLKSIGAGLCCAFVSMQLGGYANQVLMQFPNCLLFYGGLSLVYVLPRIEPEWINYEEKLFQEQEERRRLKEEKKRASRV